VFGSPCLGAPCCGVGWSHLVVFGPPFLMLDKDAAREGLNPLLSQIKVKKKISSFKF